MTYTEDSWNSATRGDEMLRYALDCGVSVKRTAWAAANCARVLVGSAPESERDAMLAALDVVYRWCHGEASDAELVASDVAAKKHSRASVWDVVSHAHPCDSNGHMREDARWLLSTAYRLHEENLIAYDAGPLVREAIPWQAICDAQARAA